MNRRTHPAAGFTLTEALVAVAIFAIGMAGVMPMAVSNMRGTNNAAVRTRAVALAQEEIEQHRAKTFAQIPAPGTVGAATTIDTVYTRQWSVAAVPTPLTGDADDVRRVRVVVNWNLPDTAGSVTLVTSKTRY